MTLFSASSSFFSPVAKKKGSSDDIINFAFNADRYGVQLWILNQGIYGIMNRPLELEDDLNVRMLFHYFSSSWSVFRYTIASL